LVIIIITTIAYYSAKDLQSRLKQTPSNTYPELRGMTHVTVTVLPGVT